MDAAVQMQLVAMEVALTAAPKRRMFSSSSWANDVPREPGVYVVWDILSKAPVYVGESSDLRSRMCDVGRSVNHTFRRAAAVTLGVPTADEEVLSHAMSARYDLSFVTIGFGRAELEDYLILRWRRTLLNRPTKRLLRGVQYGWVEAVEPAGDPGATASSLGEGGVDRG